MLAGLNRSWLRSQAGRVYNIDKRKQIKAVKQTQCCKVDQSRQRRVFSVKSGAGKWADSKKKGNQMSIRGSVY